MTYKIIRFRFDGAKTVIRKGLTLEEAQSHCNNPETSSETASAATLATMRRKHGNGPWFDGYEVER